MEAEIFDYKGHKITYYHARGYAGNVVLMHGYSFNSVVWEEMGLVEALNKRGMNVLCVDVPGFPRSVNRDALGEGEIVNMLERFIGTLKGKVFMLGSSASGHIALKFAEEYGSVLSGLIVVAPVRLESVDLGIIRARILGIWGSEDDVSPPSENSVRMGAIKGSEVAIIEGAGHACYLDKPKEFIGMVLKFIND